MQQPWSISIAMCTLLEQCFHPILPFYIERTTQVQYYQLPTAHIKSKFVLMAGWMEAVPGNTYQKHLEVAGFGWMWYWCIYNICIIIFYMLNDMKIQLYFMIVTLSYKHKYIYIYIYAYLSKPIGNSHSPCSRKLWTKKAWRNNRSNHQAN